MKNNCKDNDVVDYKEKAINVVFSCLAFNILLLITIAIIYRRRKCFFQQCLFYGHDKFEPRK